MKSLYAFAKFIVCVTHLFIGMWTIATKFKKASDAERSAHIAAWARGLLGALGVQIQAQGQKHEQAPMLVVANHISWLDILVLLSVLPVRFVSKSEVKSWPVIGWLATNAGTLYIERASRRDAMRVVTQVADALKAGQMIAVFPEGTTSDGSGLLPFHGNLLQSAIDAACPAQPVVLRYSEHCSLTPSRAAAYIDEDTLLRSVWRLLTGTKIVARIEFLTPQDAAGQDRKAFAQALREPMLQTLTALGSEEKVTT